MQVKKNCNTNGHKFPKRETLEFAFPDKEIELPEISIYCSIVHSRHSPSFLPNFGEGLGMGLLFAVVAQIQQFNLPEINRMAFCLK